MGRIMGFVVAACFIGFLILSAWLQDRRKKRQPVYECKATKLSGRLRTLYHTQLYHCF